jgi:hypothetical protein
MIDLMSPSLFLFSFMYEPEVGNALQRFFKMELDEGGYALI